MIAVVRETYNLCENMCNQMFFEQENELTNEHELTGRVKREVECWQQQDKEYMEKRARINEEQERDRVRIEHMRILTREQNIVNKQNDMYLYFQLNNDDAKNGIALKFRRNESDDGYGYDNDFTAGCFGHEDGEIDNALS